MRPNYYHTFKYKVTLAEQDEPAPEEQTPAEAPATDTPPEEAPPAEAEETDLEKILSKSRKVTYTLIKLLSTYDNVSQKAKEEIRNLVSDIRCISYKPTTFRVVLSNNNFFDLKYDPTPLQLKYVNDFKPSDLFYVNVLGKKYSLSNKSELEQALDYIQKIQKDNPIILKEPGEGEPGGPAGGAGAAAPAGQEAPAEKAPEEKK